jgi:hypothetical protein
VIAIFTKRSFLAATLVLALASPVLKGAEQTSPSAPLTPKSLSLESPDPQLLIPVTQPLIDFKDSDIKFNLESLMNVLRDHRHEGWVLSAYPDPKTSRPLIGAGFSLDVMATEHLQSDPLNPNPFLEPSSAQLWQAAGLDSDRLQRILDQFDHDLKAWGKKNYRRKLRTHTLAPELTEEEATRLLRISTIQAVHNARAYCRDFDQLTAPQQMALSQLVFQMGVNLDEFDQFLSTLNGDVSVRDLSQSDGSVETEGEHWKTLQRTLIESQWARQYTSRAASVIAMFDPDYEQDPSGAERRVEATIRPPVTRHRKKPHVASLRAVNDSNHTGKMPRKKAPGSQYKRKA